MQIRCPLSELLLAIQAVSGVISRRTYMPILSGLEIRANDLIEVRATDMEVSLEIVIKGQIIKEGAAIVPAKLLLDILKTLPQREIELKTIENTTHLDCGNIHFELQGFNPEDYPQATESMIGAGLKLESPVLKKQISQVIRAVSQDEAKTTLTGILWQAQENLLTLVACDSYRLAVAESTILEKGTMDILIPGSACRLLTRLLGDDDLIMMWDDDKVVFSFRNHNLEARLLVGKHVEWQPLIPLVFAGKAELSVKDLEQALKRVALLSPKGTQVVKFSLEPERLTLWTRSHDQGEAKEELSISWSGEPLVVDLNASFCLDGLVSLPGEKVLFQVDEAKQKVLLRDPKEESFSYLLMAVKVPEE